jgi:hypothetical protein
MVNLNGHEAGNGGHSQRTPKAHRDSSTRKADFQPGSYGYRPKRTAHEAVYRVAQAIDRSKTRIIDLDLRAYFDNVQHYLPGVAVKPLGTEGLDGINFISVMNAAGPLDGNSNLNRRFSEGKMKYLSLAQSFRFAVPPGW